jgi:hypothetical protein
MSQTLSQNHLLFKSSVLTEIDVNMQRILPSKKRGRPLSDVNSTKNHLGRELGAPTVASNRWKYYSISSTIESGLLKKIKRHPKRLPEGLHSDEPDWEVYDI